MPLPMVHIAVAREILRLGGAGRDEGAFYLGAIAPDAVHMRAGYTSQYKADAHFCAIWSRKYDPALWRERTLAALAKCRGDDFCVGYAAHVLTDIVWNNTVGARAHDAFEADPAPALSRAAAYYNDADLVDILLHGKLAWRASAFAALSGAKARAFGALVAQEECARWQARVLAWFDAHRARDYLPLRYMTEAAVDEFILAAAREIADLLAFPNIRFC